MNSIKEKITVIEVGDKVTMTINKEKITYEITSDRSNPRSHIISGKSPLGKTLMGKKKGDFFEYAVFHKTEETITKGVIEKIIKRGS
jgi:transcription elongation GreA/GreB family factor